MILRPTNLPQDNNEQFYTEDGWLCDGPMAMLCKANTKKDVKTRPVRLLDCVKGWPTGYEVAREDKRFYVRDATNEPCIILDGRERSLIALRYATIVRKALPKECANDAEPIKYWVAGEYDPVVVTLQNDSIPIAIIAPRRI